MRLAELVARESGIALENVMLLRHSNREVATLRKHGGDLLEFTAIQPVETRYDYHHPERHVIRVVAVIVDDHLLGVFRVGRTSRLGTNYSLGSPGYVEFETARRIPVRRCALFPLERVPCSADGRPVRGWGGSRTRTPVQRIDGGFFLGIEV